MYIILNKKEIKTFFQNHSNEDKSLIFDWILDSRFINILKFYQKNSNWLSSKIMLINENSYYILLDILNYLSKEKSYLFDANSIGNIFMINKKLHINYLSNNDNSLKLNFITGDNPELAQQQNFIEIIDLVDNNQKVNILCNFKNFIISNPKIFLSEIIFDIYKNSKENTNYLLNLISGHNSKLSIEKNLKLLKKSFLKI